MDGIKHIIVLIMGILLFCAAILMVYGSSELPSIIIFCPGPILFCYGIVQSIQDDARRGNNEKSWYVFGLWLLITLYFLPIYFVNPDRTHTGLSDMISLFSIVFIVVLAILLFFRDVKIHEFFISLGIILLFNYFLDFQFGLNGVENTMGTQIVYFLFMLFSFVILLYGLLIWLRSTGAAGISLSIPIDARSKKSAVLPVMASLLLNILCIILFLSAYILYFWELKVIKGVTLSMMFLSLGMVLTLIPALPGFLPAYYCIKYQVKTVPKIFVLFLSGLFSGLAISFMMFMNDFIDFYHNGELGPALDLPKFFSWIPHSETLHRAGYIVPTIFPVVVCIIASLLIGLIYYCLYLMAMRKKNRGADQDKGVNNLSPEPLK